MLHLILNAFRIPSPTKKKINKKHNSTLQLKCYDLSEHLFGVWMTLVLCKMILRQQNYEHTFVSMYSKMYVGGNHGQFLKLYLYLMQNIMDIILVSWKKLLNLHDSDSIVIMFYLKFRQLVQFSGKQQNFSWLWLWLLMVWWNGLTSHFCARPDLMLCTKAT